ncbi:tannase/feruloyl esterase family alpha/beta hydrolase [Mangrovicoccus algicola]|uniref:Tannase/feruloyl esterase family alpha/beta hydrolase n=1 Tax=Mangrovicoccus algicola TaxID=2771008 RepID=A0A8J6Z6L6_9RHOB|nr:tannase/feruloyl esterase family alpha/beta hydrolase [Mangrovicoccus algicola]MBE3638799.1 tannase/feruloyl esterase family alpha/beta hydrolase [Mangrovicoccus algicola]
MPDETVEIYRSTWVAAGPDEDAEQDLPAYCKVTGIINARTGANDLPFGSKFELRLPEGWNGRFYFQGGGGLDGRVRPAYGGSQPMGQTAAVAEGYAVISTDAGHEDKDSSFGLDPQAREDWGYQSLHDVTLTGKALTEAYYGTAPHHSYLIGCSNGGRQGMMASQRFPELFDGIVAGAPVFRLSRSHIDSAWGLQKLTAIAPEDAGGNPILSKAFSDAELDLLAGDIVRQCDARDGLSDGLVLDPAGCDYDVTALRCGPGQDGACLSDRQVETLTALHEGSRDSKGNRFYVEWSYDPAIGSDGPDSWGRWRLGTSDTPVPNAIKAGLSNNGIKYVFLTPPDPDFDIIGFDFDSDPQRMEASAAFADATSTDLAAYRDRGGKILFYHGTGDAAISANDTARYMAELTEDMGEVDTFARYFPVPGMGHCRGGPGADSFDVLDAIVAWVEDGQAPERLIATGGELGGRTRPLCPWPTIATYDGAGREDEAASFVCQ